MRRSCPTSLPRNRGSSYSEKPRMEVLQLGEARLRNEPVPGRLRRPPGNSDRPRALSSLDRARARPIGMKTPEWDAERRDFAAAWRSQPKWVVSRSLKSVGPNATLVEDDLEAVVRGLKAQLGGEIAGSGPDLAQSLN